MNITWNWIVTDDELPPNLYEDRSDQVLIYIKHGDMQKIIIAHYDYYRDRWAGLMGPIDYGQITHWCYLPNRPTTDRPKIVCLCGSTRFWKTFQQAGLQETLAGHIVLSIGAASGTDDDHFGNLPRDQYNNIKTMLDELHLRKIDLADEVLILNVDGYIGESTRNELNYALANNKPVRYWQPQPIAGWAGPGPGTESTDTDH